MSVKKEKNEVDSKSYQDQLNDVDKEISDLLVKKKDLAKLALKEISGKKEMPLSQLNSIGQMGYEESKKLFGDKWVE